MVVGWLLVGIIILLAGVAIFKSQDFVFIISLIKKNLFITFIVCVILLLSFTFYKFHKVHDVDLTSFGGVVQAGRLYFAWFLNLFKNVGSITGYAIKQDWILNSTNITKITK